MTVTVYGATARALNAIKPVHCPAPDYRPAQTVHGHMPCTYCGNRLNFTVFAAQGATTGRCTTTGCLKWSE